MSFRRIASLVLAAALIVPVTTVTVAAATSTSAEAIPQAGIRAAVGATEQDTAVQRILADTNAARAAEGLPALALDPQVSGVAQNWTDRMASTQTMSHNPDYSSQIPAGWTAAAENVAYGYTPSTVTTAWLNSPGHRANILGDFTDIGIGYQVDAAGRGWYTQNFARYAVRTLTATPTPRISGAADVGRQIAATTGDWAPAPVALTYQWMRQGVAIAGATAPRYTVVAADVDKALTVRVTGSRSGYSTVVRTSATVTGKYPLTATPTPTITGTARVGGLLTANPGAWTPSPVNRDYRWKRDGVEIAGATAKTYTTTSADAGRTVTVSVTGWKTSYRAATRTSAGLLIAG